MSSTLRLFVNDNRISTAVTIKSGGLLQVYPVKMNFTNEAQWRTHWENELKPKITIKAEEPKPTPAVDAPKKPSWQARLGLGKHAPKKASLSDWTFKSSPGSIACTLPAGDYYIGDLCYVLGDDIYDNIFGGFGYESGVYTEKATGRSFVVDGTAYGDGVYPSSDGKKFMVDAGIIGICPTSLMAKNDGGGHIYKFKDEVKCHFANGRYIFNSGPSQLVIDTTGDDDAEEYDDDDY